jgi:hypothetical protein
MCSKQPAPHLYLLLLRWLCAAVPSAAVSLLRLQMTAQDVGTMMRFGAAPIIFLVNNAGYAIEIEIHDGPYNQ